MQWLGNLFSGIALAISSLFGWGSHVQNNVLSTSTTPVIVASSTKSIGSTEVPATNTSASSTIYFQGEATMFSKDSMHVYDSYSNILPNADPATFTVLGYEEFPGCGCSEYLAKDKNQVYYDGDNGLTVPKGVDISTFTVVNGLYAKDKNHVYDEVGQVIMGADPATFVSLGSSYFKDKNNIYFGSSSMTVKSPATFTVLAGGYAKDVDAVYYNGEPFPGFDPATFSVLSNSDYVKDSKQVYMNDGSGGVGSEGIIVGADPKTFETLAVGNQAGTYSGDGGEWSKDAQHVYFGLDPLPSADPSTFVVLNARYGKDASHVFALNEIVPGADPNTFTVFPLNVWFGKDATHVFTGTTLIVGADPATFTLCDQSTQSCTTSGSTAFNAQDKNHKYEYGKVVQ